MRYKFEAGFDEYEEELSIRVLSKFGEIHKRIDVFGCYNEADDDSIRSIIEETLDADYVTMIPRGHFDRAVNQVIRDMYSVVLIIREPWLQSRYSGGYRARDLIDSSDEDIKMNWIRGYVDNVPMPPRFRDVIDDIMYAVIYESFISLEVEYGSMDIRDESMNDALALESTAYIMNDICTKWLIDGIESSKVVYEEQKPE